jgi:hypothetical protein
MRQTIDWGLDIDQLEGPESGLGCWDVSDVLSAKAGRLPISDDGEVGAVLRLGSELGTSMESEYNIRM